MEFFRNTNYDFIGRGRGFLILSALAAAIGVLAMGVNQLRHGSILNYGTDFLGGSELHVEFAKGVDPARIREALEGGGYSGAEVVSLKDERRKHFYLLRLSQVSAFAKPQMDKARAELAKLDSKLRKFDHPEQGDKVFVRFEKTIEPSALSAAFGRAGVAVQDVQQFGRLEDHAYQVTLGGLEREIERVFEARLGAGAVKDIPQVESVGAKVGKKLRNDGVKSLVYTILLILAYIWFRFDFHFAPGAIVAMVHDVLMVVGVFALFWKEFTLQSVAALLTIAGYSVNDTIVVFDRVRENLVRLRDRRLAVLVNTSVNETLSRTVLTGMPTLFATFALWYFTRGAVRDFALAMLLGVVFGTYSSIFVAAPIYVWMVERFPRNKPRV
ncbi:MAG: protein translocase subunit SecF [Myxococcota bacterium]